MEGAISPTANAFEWMEMVRGRPRIIKSRSIKVTFVKVLLIAFPLLQVGELTVARTFGDHMVSGLPMATFMDHE